MIRVGLVARRYAKETLAVRAMLDQAAETLHVSSPLHKIPYLLVIGDREMESGQAAVRTREGEDLGSMPIADVIGRFLSEVAARA